MGVGRHVGGRVDMGAGSPQLSPNRLSPNQIYLTDSIRRVFELNFSYDNEKWDNSILGIFDVKQRIQMKKPFQAFITLTCRFQRFR